MSMNRANIPYSVSAEQQRLMDMRQCIGVGNISDDLLRLKLATTDLATTQLNKIVADMKAKAKTLSDRELLEEIYVMLKTR